MQGLLPCSPVIFSQWPNEFCRCRRCRSGLQGFHSSFWTTQGGLSVNIGTFGLCSILSKYVITSPILPFWLSDVSTTMIIHPGPVVDFLIANQNVNDPFQFDWAKVAIFRLLLLLWYWLIFFIQFMFMVKDMGSPSNEMQLTDTRINQDPLSLVKDHQKAHNLNNHKKESKLKTQYTPWIYQGLKEN